jgi:hypothetical protein
MTKARPPLHVRFGICLALAAGCAGPPIVSSSSEAVQVSGSLDLPGCASVTSDHALTVVKTGDADRYLVYDGEQPLCVDTRAGLASIGVVHDESAAAAVPGELGRVRRGSSNPMPGSPIDPVSSNPLPGTDPGDSNPMPGRPGYPSTGLGE